MSVEISQIPQPQEPLNSALTDVELSDVDTIESRENQALEPLPEPLFFDLEKRYVVGEMKADPGASEVCFRTEDTELIKRARRFTAGTYLKRGFIKPEDIGEDGGIKPALDPYLHHSEYYVLLDAMRDKMVATVRKIRYDSEKGKESFPVLDHEAELYPEYVTKLQAIGYENLVEISALVKDKELDADSTAALQLYRKIFLDAWSNGREEESAFIMACSPKLFETFKLLFDGSMKRIGPNLQYPGQETVPAMFAMKEGAVELIDRSKAKDNHFSKVHQIIIDYFLDGADAKTLHPSIMSALKRNDFVTTLARMKNSGVELPEEDIARPRIRDLKNEIVKAVLREKISRRKPEVIGAIGLLGYTAVRTVMVGEGISPHSDVDWRVFLGIEVATTPQYVWGIGEMARSALNPDSYSKRRKLGALAASGSALVLPYAYVAAEGSGMPQQGWVGFGGLIAFAGVTSGVGAVRRRMQRNKESITPSES